MRRLIKFESYGNSEREEDMEMDIKNGFIIDVFDRLIEEGGDEVSVKEVESEKFFNCDFDDFSQVIWCSEQMTNLSSRGVEWVKGHFYLMIKWIDAPRATKNLKTDVIYQLIRIKSERMKKYGWTVKTEKVELMEDQTDEETGEYLHTPGDIWSDSLDCWLSVKGLKIEMVKK
jgi:hypothetical protein